MNKVKMMILIIKKTIKIKFINRKATIMMNSNKPQLYFINLISLTCSITIKKMKIF